MNAPIRHVGDPRFGIFLPNNLTIDEYLSELKTDLSKADNSVDAQLILRQFYETRFGVFDHIKEGDKRPMSTVALYDTEENGRSSALYSRIENIVESKVLDYVRMSLVDFLALPREYTTLLIELAMKKVTREGAMVEGLQQQLKNLQNGKEK